MHHIRAILGQVASRRLLDIKDAIETGRRGFTDPPQKVEQISDVGTALVEIKRVLPIGRSPSGLSAIDDAIDAEDAGDVSFEIAAVEFDLEADQAVARDPLLQR